MFVLLFTSCAVVLNVYFLWRLRRATGRLAALRPHGRVTIRLIGVGSAVLTAGRLLSMAPGVRVWETGAYVLKEASVVWVVLLFLFFSAGLALHAWNLLAELGGRLVPALGALRVPPRSAFGLLCGLTLAAGAWGWFEAGTIRVRRVAVTVDHLPPGISSLRIAQITDLHVGSLRTGHRVRQMAELLRDISPDLLLSTGDLVEDEWGKIESWAHPLREIRPSLGKYAVMGNHEFYPGIAGSLAFHEAAGFRVLRQQSAVPVPGLRLAGVDDPAVRRFLPGASVDEVSLLPEGPRGELTILLKHQPTVNRAALGRFDLQLSGHTHGGQVFPFGLFLRLIYAFSPGLHDLGGGSSLFLSRGAGTWGAPLRVGSPPEVVLFEFRCRERAPLRHDGRGSLPYPKSP